MYSNWKRNNERILLHLGLCVQNVRDQSHLRWSTDQGYRVEDRRSLCLVEPAVYTARSSSNKHSTDCRDPFPHCPTGHCRTIKLNFQHFHPNCGCLASKHGIQHVRTWSYKNSEKTLTQFDRPQSTKKWIQLEHHSSKLYTISSISQYGLNIDML